MKKIYIFVLAAAMLLAVDAKAQLGIGVGYNYLNTTERLADESDDESLDGFYVEATYDLNFLDADWGTLGLQPALRYTFGGEVESERILGVNAKASFTEHYLDIPVNVKYSYEFIQSKLKAYAFAGPVFSMGLASTASAAVEDNKEKINNYKDTGYGRFDLKLGLGAGVTLAEKFNVKLGYNIGMLNRCTDEHLKKDLKYHTGVFFVGVGYNF